MLKASPARMFPSKMMAGELPTLIVASLLTIQKILSACALPISENVIIPFTVKAPSIWIMKTAFGSPKPSNVKAVPVAVEMSPEDAYTVFPKKVWLVAVVTDPVAVKDSAALSALRKSAYAIPTVVPGAFEPKKMVPVAVPGGKPVIVSLAPTSPMTFDANGAVTDVPVFEIVPPRSPNEMAVPRFTEIGPPKAGTTTATAIANQINLCRIFPPFARSFRCEKPQWLRVFLK
jgi:hypothetical protein